MLPEEFRLQPPSTKEKDSKTRVFALAKELSVELKREIKSKELLDFCKSLGFEGITNQFHGLENEQVSVLRDHVKKGPVKTADAPTFATVKPVTLPPPGKIENRMQTLPKAKAPVKAAPVVVEEPAEPVVVESAPTPVFAEATPDIDPVPATESDLEPEATSAPHVVPSNFTMASNKPMNLSGKPNQLSKPAPSSPKAPTPPAAQQSPPKPAATVPPPPPPIPPQRSAMPPQMTQGQRPPQSGPGAPPRSGGPGSPGYGQRLPSPGMKPPTTGAPRPTTTGGHTAGPGGHSTGPAPRPTIGGKGAPQVAPPMIKGQVKLTPEMVAKIREMSQKGQKAVFTHVQKTGDVAADTKTGGGGVRPGGPPRDGAARPPVGRPAPGMAPRPMGDPNATDDDEKKKAAGGVIGRDSRHKSRQDKGRSSSSTSQTSIVVGADGSVEIIEQKSGSRRGPRQAMLDKLRRRQMQGTVARKEGPVEIANPITVRSLSEAIGMKTGELAKRLLKETSKLYGNNSPVEFDVAELIAIEKGIHLVLKKQETAESKLMEAYEKRATEVDPALLVPRAPVVTIMGHVDHGKTSLLDKIRQEFGVQSDVVSTEAGGITQVIRAWQVEKDDKRITFLDTPGHEAFTKMRARGANVTDIVVIVVAATDGVMPQTEEAIAHARAAEVDIIVAINKIDMPNANLDKTRRQLYSLNLLPDDMGGETPFVETSAVTGAGISELLDTIFVVSELNETLVADPSHPASGTCLEAYMEGQEGVMATMLVQQGTLRKGDVVICGSTFGRVRAMYDDHGRSITEAGPSTPVKISGLDDVPDADDPFYAVEDLATAREISEKRKDIRRGQSLTSFAPVSLESLTAAKTQTKITELKVIIKAEARGSVEAIKKELEKLTHEEVRCRVLHAGIGAITESDVILALTSPSDTILIGFNVTADDEAIRLAEERKIPLNEYDIIYKLTDHVKSALEGKLKPIEEVVHLGRAVIRETFKNSKVGTIAGCYVTSGVIERSARVRLIRQGVVVFPHGEKVVGLDSLKRFKDDAKEVREGFECGMKISGYDDVKVDDVIEAFKIEIKMRTL
ncbi:hypothetical protein BH11PLA2_BH11PLA2_05880 [soil metagenome]